MIKQLLNHQLIQTTADSSSLTNYHFNSLDPSLSPRFATAYMTTCNDVTQVNTSFPLATPTQPNPITAEQRSKSNKQPTLNAQQIKQAQRYDELCAQLNIHLKSPADFPTFIQYRSYIRKQYQHIFSELLSRYGSDIPHYLHASALNTATENPTNLTNGYWQAIVQLNLNAYEIDDALSLNRYQDSYDKSDMDSFEAARNPLWSMQRMGQSCTVLPDGTEVLIGGEYEDYYDPQFCIYNDVIVTYSDGTLEIYGYPKHIFPPTDFHTATLVDDEIWIIGSLGYVDDRQFSQTQVCVLDIHSFHIRKLETVNSMGWVHDHQATYRDGQIIVHRGKVLTDNDSPCVYEPNSWALNLKTRIWQNLTQRQWQGFYIARKDNGFLHLDEYGFLERSQFDDARYQQDYDMLTKALGIPPDVALYQTLYIPPIKHEVDKLTHHDDEAVIFIDDIKVRFVNENNALQVYIEGILPEKTVNILKDNLKHKLEKLENMACEVIDFE